MIVIGHKNPDTDSVVSSLVFSNFLNKTGKNAKCFLLGEANKETNFIFSFFSETIPPVINEDISGKEVFLVDHNDLSQSIAKEEDVVGILDHHLISGIKTSKPIFFRTETLGSSASLVYKMFKENNINLEKKDACLLLSAIISDTLNLKSPTTTDEDRFIFQELKNITGIDSDDLAEKMFSAKSDFSDISMKEIVSADLKEFNFNSNKVVIAVAETTKLDYFYSKEKEVVKTINEVKEEGFYDYLFFAAVDIVNQNTMFFPAGEKERLIIEKIFKGEEKENFFFLKNVVSRKKDIAPYISEYFNNI